MNRDQIIGGLLLIAAAIVAIIYIWALFFIPNMKVGPYAVWQWALIIPILILVLGVLGIVGWIGYTLVTTPPPEELTSIEEESEEKEEEKSEGEK